MTKKIKILALILASTTATLCGCSNPNSAHNRADEEPSLIRTAFIDDEALPIELGKAEQPVQVSQTSQASQPAQVSQTSQASQPAQVSQTSQASQESQAQQTSTRYGRVLSSFVIETGKKKFLFQPGTLVVMSHTEVIFGGNKYPVDTELIEDLGPGYIPGPNERVFDRDPFAN